MCFEIMKAEVLVYALRGWGRGARTRPEPAAPGSPAPGTCHPAPCQGSAGVGEGGRGCLRRRALERAGGSGLCHARGLALGCLLLVPRGLCDQASWGHHDTHRVI